MACTETASASMAFLQFCICWHNSSAILIKAGLEKGTVPAASICTSSNIYIAVVALAYWYHAMQTVPETSTWSHTHTRLLYIRSVLLCVCAGRHVHQLPKIYVTMLFSILENSDLLFLSHTYKPFFLTTPPCPNYHFAPRHHYSVLLQKDADWYCKKSWAVPMNTPSSPGTRVTSPADKGKIS